MRGTTLFCLFAVATVVSASGLRTDADKGFVSSLVNGAKAVAGAMRNQPSDFPPPGMGIVSGFIFDSVSS